MNLDCFYDDWTREDCSKSCGGGFRNVTRRLKWRGETASCTEPIHRVEHCNENMCPGHMAAYVILSVVSVALIAAVICFFRRRKEMPPEGSEASVMSYLSQQQSGKQVFNFMQDIVMYIELEIQTFALHGFKEHFQIYIA